MTATVKYWRLPGEELDFVRYLESIEPTVAFEYTAYPTEAEIAWHPVGSVSPMTDVHLIAPARFVPDCRAFWRPTPPAGFTIDHTSSPVLYYRPGRFRDGKLLESTAMSADWRYLGEDRKFHDFPVDFVRWGKRVMQWVRRVAPGWHGHRTNRITPKVQEAQQQGLELVG